MLGEKQIFSEIRCRRDYWKRREDAEENSVLRQSMIYTLHSTLKGEIKGYQMGDERVMNEKFGNGFYGRT
jgi:hypothetical protein